MPNVVFAKTAEKNLESIVSYTKKRWGKEQAVSYVSGLQNQA
jgi:plasmid stabilization system protein ParE